MPSKTASAHRPWETASLVSAAILLFALLLASGVATFRAGSGHAFTAPTAGPAAHK